MDKAEYVFDKYAEFIKEAVSKNLILKVVNNRAAATDKLPKALRKTMHAANAEQAGRMAANIE